MPGQAARPAHAPSGGALLLVAAGVVTAACRGPEVPHDLVLVTIDTLRADRLGVYGYSYGGFMTSWIIGHTDRFKAAVIGAPVGLPLASAR